jgi:MFS superfamily sulfate permease-like transporter
VVIYDFSHSGYVDPSAALAIDEMVELSIRHGRHVILAGLRDSALKVLGAMGVLDRIPAEQQFDLRKDAIEAAVEHCLSQESHDVPPSSSTSGSQQ